MRVLAALIVAASTLLAPAAAQTIVATPSVGSANATVDEPVRFWIDVRNSGVDSARALRIAGMDAPGFSYQLNPPCACSSASCIQSTACRPLKATLAAGERFAVWGELIPTEPHTNQAAWILLRWEDRANNTQEVVVPIGRLTATYRALELARGLLTFLKDVAIPVSLAVFGFWLQRWERRRAERLARDERRRARRLAEEDQRRANALAEQTQRHTEVAETWREMLPLSHEYAIKYYMPVVAAAEMAVRMSNDARAIPPPEDSDRRAFYMSNVFWRRTRAQIDALNGFYFKDRCGEEMATALFAHCSKLYFEDRPESRKRRDAIMSLLDPSGPGSRYTAFVAKWDHEVGTASPVGRAIVDEFASFQSWLRHERFMTFSDALGAFAAIMRLEMNRVYEPWYGKSEQMRMKPGPARAAWSVIQEAAETGSVTEGELHAYLEGNGCGMPDSSTLRQ